MKRKYPYVSKQFLHWHDRVGHPTVHLDPKTGKTYVMVRATRAEGGGTKRLYDYRRHLRTKKSKTL